MPLQKPVNIVKAAAGSGKTFSLTAHYICLLFAPGIRFSEILAVTFTNKATAEMKSRILEVLESLAKGETKADPYRAIVLTTYPDLHEGELMEKAITLYRNILHDYSRFAVSTIDSFVQRIIRSFSFELGLSASYRLEMNTEKVKNDLVLRLNALLDEREDLLDWIVAYAQRQIEQDNSWNYTRVLGQLAKEIFKEHFLPFDRAIKDLGIQERNQLFATLDRFGKEKASAFEDQLNNMFQEVGVAFDQSGVSTDDLLGKSRNLIPKIKFLQADDPNCMVKVIEYVDAPEKWKKGGLDDAMERLYQKINPILHRAIAFHQQHAPTYFLAKAMDENIYFLRLMKEMSVLLAEYRAEQGVLLIGDAQHLLHQLNQQQGPNPSFLWEKVSNRYNYFLFDEFQDTSASQWANLSPLLINTLAEQAPNEHRANHLIVGDIKQSIYRWRNGDWRILKEQAAKDIGPHYIQQSTLTENYRSREHIVAFNNFVFRHAPHWLQEKINNKVRNELSAEQYGAWWQAEGFEKIIMEAYGESAQQLPGDAEGKRKGGKVQVHFLEPQSAHFKARASSFKPLALQKMGQTILHWLSTKQFVAKQIGILVRSNKEAGEVIDHLLSLQEGAPAQQRFEVISGDALALSNSKAVRLLLNTFHALITESEKAAIFRAHILYLYHELFPSGAGPIVPDQWMALTATESDSWMATLPKAVETAWPTWPQLPLAELTEAIIAAFGISGQESNVPYLLAFRDLIASFSAFGEKGIAAFLQYWQEEGVNRSLPSSAGGNAIEVLTIHKSKGLAFDVVMVPFCFWELDGMPNSNFWVDTSETDYKLLKKAPLRYRSLIGRSSLYRQYYEEMLFNYMDALNLLYVATTRSREELYISAPNVAEGKDSDVLIADLLRHVLRDHGRDIDLPFGEEIHYPKENTAAYGTTALCHTDALEPLEHQYKGISVWQSPDAQTNHHLWHLDHYPCSGILRDALGNREIKPELMALAEKEEQVRSGLQLHELLARGTDIEELPQHVAHMQTEGLINGQEAVSILFQAQEMLGDPALAQLLNNNYKVMSEQPLISPEGQTLRPDKVLIGNNETIVLDFKFTAIESAAHVRQVSHYRDLLVSMGYANVKAYLYYPYRNGLVQV